MLHNCSPEAAEITFAYLSKKYNIIALDTYIDALESKDTSKIPQKAMIVTFDDGHIGNYELLPIIRKHNVPITIFLCAAIIGTKRHYWFKHKDSPIPIEKLKILPNSQRLEILSKTGFKQSEEFKTPEALQQHHISEMKVCVNFQSHTMFHPILPKCNYSEAKLEIQGSKQLLENEYGLTINAIAYPNGDYSERDIKLAKEAGYKCGITVDYGYNNILSNPFKLKRLSINDTNDINELIVKSSGLWGFLKTRNGRKQTCGYTNITEQ